MIAASPTLLAVLDGSNRHRRRVARAEILVAGQPVQTVDVEDGSVSQDGTNDGNTRTLSCSLIDPTRNLYPASAADLLATPGTEIRPARGYITNLGPEYVSMGVFGSLKVTGTKKVAGGTELQIEASDRWSDLDADDFTATWTIDAGTGIPDAITALVLDSLPDARLRLEPTALVLPDLSYGVGDKRTDAIRDLAAAYGCRCGFDTDGVFYTRPVPDATLDPVVWRYVEGPSSTFADTTRTFDSTQRVRVVVVVASATDDAGNPITARTIDPALIDPATGTIRIGDRRRVHIERVDTVTDPTQAQVYSDALYRHLAVAFEQPVLTAVPNPLHEAGDVHYLERGALRLAGNYVVQRVDTPIRAGTQTLTYVAAEVPQAAT